MKTIATIAVSLLLSLGLLVSPASGESRPGVTPSSRCVTPSEFWSLEGKTRAEAEKTLDWEGASWKVNANTPSRRLYRGCSGSWKTSVVRIDYRGGKVSNIDWAIYR